MDGYTPVPSTNLKALTTTLNFFDTPSTVANDYRWSTSNETERPSNLLPPDSHEVQIHDLRSLTPEHITQLGLTLEKAGFEVLQGWGREGSAIANAWKARRWEDKTWVEGEYYSYIRRMLCEKFHASQVEFFDYTIRKRTNTHGIGQVPPAEQTHIDQTYWAAIERVRSHLGEDALQHVLEGKARAIICNVWRPLVGPVTDHPLAAADFRSLNEARDFGETLPAPPGCRTGESQMLRYHPDQRWYYLSDMTTDECMLLKCFDSATGVRAPHTAFIDPNTSTDAEPRWSLEVRTISFVESGGSNQVGN